MTANQIAYQNMLETKRSNLTKEQETERHNRADEYNKLISALDNVFSLVAHGAGGEPVVTKGVDNLIGSNANYLLQYLKPIADNVGSTISEGKSVLKNKVNKFKSDFNSSISNAKDKITDLWQRAKDATANLLN